MHIQIQFTATIFLFLITGTLSNVLNEDEILVINPNMVAIMPIDQSHICTGAILNENEILTAAHCILKLKRNNYDDVQIIGRTNIIDDSEYNDKIIRSIKSVIIPNNYSSEAPTDINNLKDYRYDIAIIQVNETLDFKQTYVQPIIIASALEEANTECSIFRWIIADVEGYINYDGLYPVAQIQEATVLDSNNISIANQNACLKVNEENKVHFDQEKIFCAGHKSDMPSQICYNETASLLICDGKLQGIAFHDSDSQCTNSLQTPAIFTKVSAYAEWFQENKVDFKQDNGIIETIIKYLLKFVIIPLLQWIVKHVLSVHNLLFC